MHKTKTSVEKVVDHQWKLHNQEQNETPKKSWILKAAAIALTLSTTQVQANDLLKQCDFNNDWKISTRKTYKIDWVPKDIAKKETKCKIKYERIQSEQKLAQNEQKLAQNEKELAQEKIVLAQLDITVEWLKKEIKKIEEELSKSKEELSKSKEELERKLKWLMEQLEKIENWANNA